MLASCLFYVHMGGQLFCEGFVNYSETKVMLQNRHDEGLGRLQQQLQALQLPPIAHNMHRLHAISTDN
jgi:hypothetical protein